MAVGTQMFILPVRCEKRASATSTIMWEALVNDSTYSEYTRISRRSLMDHRRDVAFAIRAENHPLLGPGPAADIGERLRTGDGELDRALQLAGREDGDRNVRPHEGFAPEGTADVRRQHSYVRRLKAEHLGQGVTRSIGVLRGVVEGEFVSFPVRHRGMRLDRVVALERRDVVVRDFHLGSSQSAIGIAPHTIGSELEADFVSRVLGSRPLQLGNRLSVRDSRLQEADALLG
jgi:hypothetical protein